ncbi:MAG TPA: 50S ribosomal protein L9 [Gammaproteobacteria bacterium]|jgi:large subunit ribosomal protein L9|nr:50S ribosomal protein L9 [Gammaproteobacteria bacterium]
MQVILLEKNQKLGNLGDVANVKSGYARNYLIPKGKAKPATKANLAEFELIKAELVAREADILSTAQTLEAAMIDIVCTITANASEEGKLYGSVSAADIVSSLASMGHEVEKRDVNMSDAIHHVGEYQVSVALHTDIVVNIKVIVVASEGDKE